MGESDKGHLFSKRDLMYLIIPLVVERLLAVAVGMADTVMVANVGESGVSAVSLVDAINILLIQVFGALATGGAVVAGQYLGRRDKEKASKAGEQLILFVTFVSIAIMVVMYLGRNFILNVVFGSIEPIVAEYANTYMMIVFASVPFLALYNSGAALFRAMGNSNITMRISLIMNGINIVGNAILIYGFNMGVEGVAIPTLISRAVAAITIFILLRDKRLDIHIKRPMNYRLDWSMVKDILHVGIPNGIENSMFQLGKLMLLSLVSTFGTIAITANAVANTVTAFQFLPGNAIGLALVSVVSQCVGAGDYEQARYYTRELHKYTYLSLFVLNGFIILLISHILKIFNLSAETFALARKIIIFYGANVIIGWPISFLLPNTLRAAKDVRYAMVVSIGSMWVTRIGLGVLLAKYMGLEVFGVWVAMVADWYVRAAFFIHRYRGSKWEEKAVES